MKKSWIILLFIVVVIIGIIVGVSIYNSQNENVLIENEVNTVSESVEDECIDEYIELKKQAELDMETNSSLEKISPNCLMTLKRYYNECKHTMNEYIDIPHDLVNGTKEDIKKRYPNWKIEKYSSNEIILYKEFDSNCGQHFILRNDNGKITIYKINENNEEDVYEKTEISVEYLAEADKIEIQNGIRVNGIEELNQLLEDFE